MHIRRSSRLLLIGLPFRAAAFAVVVAAQSPGAPGDLLIARFNWTCPASVSDALELFNRI